MPTVELLLGKVKIEMFRKDHNPPHIHATHAEFECLIEIQTGAIYAGHLPAKQLKVARQYVLLNQHDLLTLWKTLNPTLR